MSSAAGAGLVAARLASHDFSRAFTVGEVIGAVAVVTAAVLVPVARRGRPAAKAPADDAAARQGSPELPGSTVPPGSHGPRP